MRAEVHAWCRVAVQKLHERKVRVGGKIHHGWSLVSLGQMIEMAAIALGQNREVLRHTLRNFLEKKR